MSAPFIGEIRMFGFTYAPQGWSKCDGQILRIDQQSSLFALLSTTYGGDGRVNFALPNFKGRAPIHAGTGQGLTTRIQGHFGGTEYEYLTVSQMPNHNHSHQIDVELKGTTKTANRVDPTGNILSEASVDLYYNSPMQQPDTPLKAGSASASLTIGNTGGSHPHNNMQPWLCVNFCIAMVGIWPSRP